jgi:excisionase family DNA binding protein
MIATSLPRLLTADEVAGATGLPKARVYELARDGDMPSVSLGRAVRFSEAALLKWIGEGGTRHNDDECE